MDMVDAKNYLDKKEKGLAEVVKAGGGYAVAFKKFDPDTGEALEPTIQAVSLDELNNQIKAFNKQIADIQALIDDIKALK